MYYPIKKPKPKLISGSTIPETSSTTGSGGGNASGIINTVAQVGSQAVDTFVQDKNPKYGLSYKPVGAVAAKSALKGAATGAAVGSVIPGIGTAVGAVVGGVVGGVSGFVKGKKDKEKVEQQIAKLDRQNAILSDRQSYQAYSNAPTYKDAAYAKAGMMIPKSYSFGPSPIPEMEQGGAVILGGQHHKDSGDLGKGNPGVDESGEKVVEVEKDEMLLTMDQSDKIHNLMEQYYDNPSDDVLFDLGSVARSILLNAKKQNAA